LAGVVEIMESQQVKRLPVLKDGRLIGIVSRADLLRALARLLPARKAGAISNAERHQRILTEIDKQHWAPRATVDVAVANGIVELRGTVIDDREHVGLRVIAENTPGVREVRDHLNWLEPLSGAIIEAPES
jgi:CBS-domain-containing membrane protein